VTEPEDTSASSRALDRTADDNAGGVEAVWTIRDRELPEATAARIARSIPDNTRRSYASHWKQFTKWCAENGRVARPATAETVAAYMGHLADRGLAESTMAARLAAIRALHRGAGLEPPDGIAARKVIVDRARQRADDPEAPAGPRRATPLTPADLRAIVATLDLTTAAGLRDRAVVLLAWALAARRSEVAALNISDVRVAPQGLRVTVRRSKTDQAAKGTVVKVPAGKDPQLCPRRAVRAWTAYLAGKNIHTGPLFVRVDRHGNAGAACGGRYQGGEVRTGRLTAQAIGAIITAAAKAARLDRPSGDPLDDEGPRRYTGHSARRGFVTTALARKDADAAAIAAHGRWSAGSRAFWDYYEPDRGWDKHPGDGLL
jgi:integrase